MTAPDTLLAAWEGRSAETWARRVSAATAEFHSRIGSTSDRARELVGAGSPLPAIVVADRQRRGRGRRGRLWQSDTARGLWFTVACEAAEASVETLPLRAGLAVAEALEAVVPGPRVQIKWPNDLLIDGRKVGGILCERLRSQALIGIGLNLNQSREELPAVTPPATSMRLECGHDVARGRILSTIADALGAMWTRPGPRIPASELDALNARSPLNGRPLSISGVVRDSSRRPRAVESLAATALSLLPDGSLEVRDESGSRWRVIAGTVESWS